MLDHYQLNFPGQIIFGNGTLQRLAKFITPESEILLLTGTHAVRSGLIKQIISLLNCCKISSITDIQPEPAISEVNRALEIGRSKNITAVIAIGGGSVIDVAKTVAALIPLAGAAEEYFNGTKKITGNGVFFAALPTTAGTGAEITPNAVFINPETLEKKSLKHQSMYADLAIIDPELTYSCPPHLTAASGFDALTQAIESYVSRNANPISSILASSATVQLFNNLEKACLDPVTENRSAMAEGSMTAAMAFSSSGLGAAHGLGHPIGSICKVPHGICCAILLIPVLRWNLPACETRLNELATACGIDSATKFIDALENLRHNIGIPDKFSGYGLDFSHFGFIIQNCRSGSMKSNPREMSDKQVEAFLSECANSGILT
jgi:1,3-propanediol dehydrogenase